ncbi:hypothetical protein JAK51_03830 [Stenotrophomonas maltophilia]|uniref:hypothetical protein n=1 Tax=Stenotrophomonas maltophilia TaxID=40324 RepID=UPI0021C74044|nr:hypothetical protein [Stenotrophomonas maltophilia]MCU1125369.1 hypothetical protein [Stenotrophomonas maltophilia]
MRLKVFALSASVAFLFATGSAWAGNTTSPQSAVVVSTKSTYAPDSVEAQSVLKWVKQRSPEYAPVLEGVTVEVVKKTSSSPESSGAVTRASAPPPPVPLPSSANVGDEFTVTTTDRYGNSETWGYTWVGGGNGGGAWVLVEYHYKNVNYENQDSPETLGG